MAHDHFGEKQQPAERKDQWGNTYRKMDVQPFKVERACKCEDHLTMTFSLEMETIAVSNLEALMLVSRGEEVPVEKRWTPVLRVLNGYS